MRTRTVERIGAGGGSLYGFEYLLNKHDKHWKSVEHAGKPLLWASAAMRDRARVIFGSRRSVPPALADLRTAGLMPKVSRGVKDPHDHVTRELPLPEPKLAKPVKLQVNTAGSWRDVITFDASNEFDADEVLEAAATLGRVARSNLRLVMAGPDQHPRSPQVLLRWDSMKPGWKEHRSEQGDA